MTHTEFVNSLREISNFFEAHPEIPLPSFECFDVWGITSRERLGEIARIVAPCTKIEGDGWYAIRKDFKGLAVAFCVPRRVVCTRRVTGHRTVSEKIPITFEEREREEEVVEWDCSDPILHESTKQ